MRWIFLLLFVLTLSVLGLGCGDATPDSSGLSPQVEFLWRQHPNPHPPEAARRAATEAKALLNDHPGDIQLEYYYQDRLRSFDNDSLLSEYHRRLEQNPDDPIAIILEARARKSGPYLVSVIDQALAKDDHTVEVLHLGVLGMLGKRPEQTERALELAERAVELHPNHHLAYEALATAYNTTGRHADALEAAQRAAEIHPWRHEPISLMNSALNGLGRGSETIGNVEEFFASQPTHLPSYRQLAREYRNNQQWQKLFNLEMLIASAYPENGYSWTYAADAAMQMEDMDRVYDAYEAAAQWGWFDLEYLLDSFDEVELAQFQQHPRYGTLVEMLETNREEARVRREETAVNGPINVQLRGVSGTDLDGHRVALENLRGKIVVLHFFNTTERHNELIALRLKVFWKQHPDVELISINAYERARGEDRIKRVRATKDRLDMDWRVWTISDEMAKRLRINAVPAFAVIDENGVARYRLAGYHAYVDDMLEVMVEAARTPPDSLRGEMKELSEAR